MSSNTEKTMIMTQPREDEETKTILLYTPKLKSVRSPLCNRDCLAVRDWQPRVALAFQHSPVPRWPGAKRKFYDRGRTGRKQLRVRVAFVRHKKRGNVKLNFKRRIKLLTTLRNEVMIHLAGWKQHFYELAMVDVEYWYYGSEATSLMSWKCVREREEGEQAASLMRYLRVQ